MSAFPNQLLTCSHAVGEGHSYGLLGPKSTALLSGTLDPP